MKSLGIITFCAAAIASQAAFAEAASSGAKVSQSECTSLWQQANPSGGPGVSQSAAAPYVTNFKAANPDGDASIDQNEWMAACNKGLIKASSGSGASTGASGSAGSAGSAGAVAPAPGSKSVTPPTSE